MKLFRFLLVCYFAWAICAYIAIMIKPAKDRIHRIGNCLVVGDK